MHKNIQSYIFLGILLPFRHTLFTLSIIPIIKVTIAIIPIKGYTIIKNINGGDH